MTFSLDFYTSYSQFYVSDLGFPGNTSGNFWNKDAFQDRLAISDGILGVGTECYGPVKGELIFLEKSNNEIDFDQYDHIVEGSIEIKSGILQVLDCPCLDVAVTISVLPSYYRVRIYSSNLSSVIDDEGDDFYRIEIWPEDFSGRKVLKRLSRPFD